MATPADIRYIPPAERDGGLLNSLTALWGDRQTVGGHGGKEPRGRICRRERAEPSRKGFL